jgi:hypothetical protein
MEVVMECNVEVGKYYIDNEETIYKCVAYHTTGHYSEAVLQLQGHLESQANFFFVFYKAHYAWVDRENPDYKLMDEVAIFPSLVSPQ